MHFCVKMVSLNRRVVYFRSPLMVIYFLLQGYLIESLMLQIQVDESVSKLKMESFSVVTCQGQLSISQ